MTNQEKSFFININGQQLYKLYSRFSQQEWIKIYEGEMKNAVILNRVLNNCNEIPENLNDSYYELILGFSKIFQNLLALDFMKFSESSKYTCIGRTDKDFLELYYYFGDLGSSYIDITKQSLYILDV